jgi:hypothetical protein
MATYQADESIGENCSAALAGLLKREELFSALVPKGTLYMPS